MKHPQISPMQWLVVIVLALVATACASIGRPEGGPRDETPPVYMTSNPPIGATNVSRQVIDLYFDENVQLQDAFNKVVVSPTQKTTPRVSANGKHVRVEIEDTLKPNTTYTIDFADAIKDLNEGNILDGFATYFSTGDSIDSLVISGMVLDARTLEPQQGVLVGVYSNLADSAIRTLPLERIARTNQYGQFAVLNLKAGDYRIYALDDVDRNYFWGPTENVAYYDVTISPTVEDITVTDTLRSLENSDSLIYVPRQGHRYLPNDVLLSMFNEGHESQYLKDYKRDIRRRFTINMATAADSLPQITIADGPLAGRDIAEWALSWPNATLDTLTYWIRDPEVLATDSLRLSVRYQRTDTANALSWTTDTLKFFYFDPPQKKPKKEEKDEEADTVPPPTVHMGLKAVTAQSHDVYRSLIFGSDQPIDTVMPWGVHLEMAQDTLWVPVKGITVEPDSLNPLLYRRIDHKWVPGEKYRLTVDSAAVANIYGEHNNTLTHEFTVKLLDDYVTIAFNITPRDTVPMVVEILDKSDEVKRTAPVIDGTATFKYLEPGTTYYARLYKDANGNGKWDTGSLDSIQPEETYYFPKKINLKKNWDQTENWDIYERPIDQQKHYDIKKNKPKLKKGEEAPYDPEEDEDDYDMFGGYNAYDNARRNNSNSRSTNGRSSSTGTRGATGMRGGAGMRMR